MKKQNYNVRKFPLLNFSWLFSILLLATIFTGCDDDDDRVDIDPQPVAYVSFYNGSPEGSALDIYADNSKINFNAFDYTDYTGYLRFFTGERTLRFTPFNAANTVAEETVVLVADSLYSVFITGQLGDRQAMIVHDDIRAEDTDNALIRVLHASPDAPTINLVQTGTETSLFNNITYREITEFGEITPGQTSFDITNAANGEFITTVANVNFLSGRVYTLIVRGFVEPPAGNNNDLSVQITPNFFNL